MSTATKTAWRTLYDEWTERHGLEEPAAMSAAIEATTYEWSCDVCGVTTYLTGCGGELLCEHEHDPERVRIAWYFAGTRREMGTAADFQP